MKKERKSLAPGTLLAPIPPAMVTVGDFENANVLTVAWTGILATQPPKTYVSVRPSRHSYGMLVEGGEFVINLPPVSLAREVDFVGIYTGKKVDKFEKCHLTKKKSEKVAPPTIAECPIALECRVSEVIPMGSHDVFFADILSVSCSEEILDSDGKMHFERADLLAYAHGEYYSLGERVGRFGFSTDNPAKKAASKDEGKKPFYENAPKGKSARKKPTSKNKGAPHGRRKRGDDK
ncbi:MAG: flavin reductase family protein [Ruminococcaceae bacterium]|nr:flavin reductase family protein [Oscillospiraceae bacterium]